MVPIQNIHCCTIKKTDKIAQLTPNKAKGFSAADLPPVPQPIVDAVTGFGSAITFGLTDLINKQLGTDDTYNSNSTASQIGGAAGDMIGFGKFKAGGKIAHVLGSRTHPYNQPKNPPYQTTRNKPTNIGGRTYSGHAVDRMQDRGIMPSVVEDTIKYGSKTASNNSTTIHYSSTNNVSVLTNKQGDVVTTTHGKLRGKRK